MKRGLFITFEGIDGCGKTTQLRLFGQHLRSLGREVEETVEPGGTDIGRQIRKILLDGGNTQLDARAELLLYFASRAQNVAEVIRPAIEAGRIVLCDRFTDSTLVYQGCGRGLGTDVVMQLDRIAYDGLRPDITVLIDIDLKTSLARAQQRNATLQSTETRIDDESAAFHSAVRDAYRALAASEPERFIVLDGAMKIGNVAKHLWEALRDRV